MRSSQKTKNPTERNLVLLFVCSIFLIQIIGGQLLRMINANASYKLPMHDAIESSLSISPNIIEVATDIKKLNDQNIATASVTITNNTNEVLTGVQLEFSNNDLIFLESSTVMRYTHLSPNSRDQVFTVSNIYPGRTNTYNLTLFSIKKGDYLIRVNVENVQRYKSGSNLVSVKVM